MAAQTGVGVGERRLQLRVGREFEEALEFCIEPSGSGGRPWPRRLLVEMALDRSPEATATQVDPKPPSNALVKRVEVGTDSPAMIQNMPSGRHFLVAAVAKEADAELRSGWVCARTLPLTEPSGGVRDLIGNLRGKCLACPCKAFKLFKAELTMNSSPAAAPCQGCGCQAQQHEKVEAPQKRQDEQDEAAETKELAAPAAAAEPSLPPEAGDWTWQERNLFAQSRGSFHPGEQAERRRARADVPSRVSVVCPTLESRQMFHEQLWSVFDAQTWPDKELVIVESYNFRPSSFFVAKAAEDDRIVFFPLQVKPTEADHTIGLKRNMCTCLASGAVLANFDDDDIYAPSYLSTMLEAMAGAGSGAVTLGSWYVFDASSGKFGYVDPVKAKEEQTANAPKDIDDWLYGYGFSYVFLRQLAVMFPYADRNFGEDYQFFDILRQTSNDKKRTGGVALLHDKYGICVHTLHPKSTSNNWAQREVDVEELEDLEVTDLSAVLGAYLRRFPVTQLTSQFIEGGIRRRQRRLEIRTCYGDIVVRCSAGVKAGDVLELLVKQVGAVARGTRLYRSGALAPAPAAEGGDGHRRLLLLPEGPPLPAKERVGLRTAALYADLAVNEEALVMVHDMQDFDMEVAVRLPHAFLRMQAVRDALVAQHGRDCAEGRRAARDVRLAARRGEAVFFTVVDLTKWLGDCRELWAPGLAELLGRERQEQSSPCDSKED